MNSDDIYWWTTTFCMFSLSQANNIFRDVKKKDKRALGELCSVTVLGEV